MLELKEFLKFFLVPQRFMVLVAATALGGVIGWGVFAAMPQSFTVRVELSRIVQQESIPEGVTVDGYYLVETSRTYADRLGAFLRDAQILQEFSQKSGSKIIRAQRETPLSWTVQITQNKQEQPASSVLEAILSKKLEEVLEESGEYVAFRAVVSDPYPSSQILTPVRAAVIGAGISLVLVVFILLSAAYFRDTRTAL